MTYFLGTTAEELSYSFQTSFYRLVLARNAAPRKVLVNGSPKSGTTWMIKMIISLPGYRGVGNFNGNIERYHSVRPGDVIHGHDWWTPELDAILRAAEIKTILLVRDPRDQLVSRVFHIKRDTQHSWHEKISPLELDEAISLCIEGGPGLPGVRKMIELAQSWMQGTPDATCVRYEELLADPQAEMERVLKFLDIKIPKPLLKTIISRNRFERLATGKKFWQGPRRQGEADPKSHFRKGITGDWLNYFKAQHMDQFKAAAGDKLIELGYERDLSW